MAYVDPNVWRPRGIQDLEQRAWEALRCTDGTSVIAGPGAGKSEFLAQKAVYLLESGLCPPPQRILAISFKSDAAENLAARVSKRCPAHLAARFSSMTFDAFTKNLVDRFHSAIPSHWRPSRSYEIFSPRTAEIGRFLYSTVQQAPEEFAGEVRQLSGTIFEPKIVGGYPLPVDLPTIDSGTLYAINKWWEDRLNRGGSSTMTFVCLNRLAHLLLRTHPPVVRALRATYPFVFVDEFQDTTYAQYSFLRVAFPASKTCVTVVGDDKQRIMTWAGARPDSFEKFTTEFHAKKFSLLYNFRSSPELVKIQHFVALALDGNSPLIESQSACKVDGDVAQVWVSQNKLAEADHVASWIRDDMATRGLAPRDYVILVKQLPEQYENDLNEAFAAAGLKIRNESRGLGRTTLQDVLVDDLAKITIAMLRLGLMQRDADSWDLVSSAFSNLRAVDPNDHLACKKIERELSNFLNDLRSEISGLQITSDNAAILAAKVHQFLDLKSFKQSYRAYGTGDLLDVMVEAFNLHLAGCAAGAPTWEVCFDTYEGKSHVPMMTIHKSKGLEYDTVVFVGLDDQAWWAHSSTNPEGKAAFFVALSRAKQRAIFSFCHERGHRRRVADLYALLTQAGVPEVEI